MTFQWHLTDACNYRCKHCYQEEYENNSLSLFQNFQILEILNDFVSVINPSKVIDRAHINFTGGEPFLYNSLLPLVQRATKEYGFSFGILSNGYLLDDTQIKLLSLLKPRFIQLSIEGSRKVNDEIRGEGAYGDIKKAIKKYKEFNIPVILSFTANSRNFQEYSKVVSLARRWNVQKIWTDRYLPYGKDDDLELNCKQFERLSGAISDQQRSIKRVLSPKTTVASDRALQFLSSGGRPYSCAAGKSLLAILPNGDLLPCRRLPIKLGNIFKDNILDIYETHNELRALRDKESLDPDCKLCFYKEQCFGGLKCLSFIKYGDFHRKDPNCWIL